MPRIVITLFAAMLLSACQQTPVLDEDSPRSRIALGSTLVLHEPLTVPVGHTRVFLQNGQARARGRVDMYYPHCNFELRTLSDAPQTIRAGRFTVIAISWNEETVVEHGRARAIPAVSLEGGDSVTLVTRLLHHRLDAPGQPELTRLTCHGGFSDPWSADFPSVNQIRSALGALVSIEPVAMKNIRVIVQFAEGVDPADPAYLGQLERDTGTSLTLGRQLRGGLAVLGVRGEGSDDELMSRLLTHPDVVNVQPDRLARPQ